MRGKAALIGFLAVQVVVVGVWLAQLWPIAAAGTPLIATDSEIWSGGAYSGVMFNFRTGASSVIAPPFSPYGPLLWATLLLVASLAAAVGSIFAFRMGRLWIAVGLAGLALVLGAGGASQIVEQWSGDTSFEAGSVTTSWLYAVGRAYLVQLFLAYALLAGYVVLAIAGFVTKEKPLGFHLFAINWIIAAGVWVAIYLGLYLLPSLNAAS